MKAPADFHECAAAGYSKRKTARVLGCSLARVCKMETELGLVFYNTLTPKPRRTCCGFGREVAQ